MFPDALHAFCKEVGVPSTLVVDPSGEQTSRQVKRFCHQVGTSLRILEEATQWANRAELYIRIFKEAIRKDLREQNCPMVLWDYGAEQTLASGPSLPSSCIISTLTMHMPMWCNVSQKKGLETNLIYLQYFKFKILQHSSGTSILRHDLVLFQQM